MDKTHIRRERKLVKKEISVFIGRTLLEKLSERVEVDFKKKYSISDCILIALLTSLYKPSALCLLDIHYLVLDHPEQLPEQNRIRKTITVYPELLQQMKEKWSKCNKNTKTHSTLSGDSDITNGEILERAISNYLYQSNTVYTDCISPLYTIVGSKNFTMQRRTAYAVDHMPLDHKEMTLIDACSATGSLFFGLKTYPWKRIILNDLNPLRTNFLNVVKKEPLKLIKKILDTDLSFIAYSKSKNVRLKDFKMHTEQYEEKRLNYRKVDCNVSIAYEMFMRQCIDKKYIEQQDGIISRVLRILPAHLKVQDAEITQVDCLSYLTNETANKLVLLDVPYMGTEQECSVDGYDYNKFHGKVARYLYDADYSFLYYCRSSAPKSNMSLSQEDKEHVMKMKLGERFLNKGFYFEKIRLEKDTELMISNRIYREKWQFQWMNYEQDLI